MTDKTVPALGDIDDITSAYLGEVADKHSVARDLLQLACERSYGTPLEEHDDIEEMARALAAVLPAARRMWAAELFGTPEEIAARKAEPLRRDDPAELCERIAPGHHAAAERAAIIKGIKDYFAAVDDPVYEDVRILCGRIERGEYSATRGGQ